MNKRLKILFYAHAVDHGGTWRCHERIIEVLNRGLFDPYAAYWPGDDNTRLTYVSDMLGPDHMISFERSPTKNSALAHTPYTDNFAAAVKPFGFDIIHFARTGYKEWPFVSRMATLQVETNVFGKIDLSPFLDRSFGISRSYNCRQVDEVVYNPVPPRRDGPDLRDELSIPDGAIVCGRIGAARSFHPWAFTAFLSVMQDRPNTYWIIVSPCQQTRKAAAGCPNIILMDPMIDDSEVEKFYRTLDIFLHYRVDGEVQSTAIAQAMLHGLPICSHKCMMIGGYNGHVEMIGPGGDVAITQDSMTQYLSKLVISEEERKRIGTEGCIQAGKYEQHAVVRRMEGLYLKWHAEIMAKEAESVLA